MKIDLQLSEDDRKKVEARATELGYATPDDYVVSLVEADLEVPISEEVEVELLEAMKSPGREMTPADWQEQRRRLIARYGKAKAG